MIRTPPGWGAHLLTQAYQSMTTAQIEPSVGTAARPAVRKLSVGDLGWALRRGIEDFGSSRTDIIFLCVIYPVVGLLLARVASGYNLLPLVFPLASGFALIGPLAGVGLAEMSRRREMGQSSTFIDALAVFRSPNILNILMLGAALVVMLLFWLVAANTIYNVTLGPQPPESVSGFLSDIIHTHAGRTMMVVGCGTGFVFALIAMTIGVVSFPMLLDRNVSLESAVMTSVRVVMRNPLTIAIWGMVIVAALVAGSIPLLLGMVFVMPVLGHATWHLYRRAVAPRT